MTMTMAMATRMWLLGGEGSGDAAAAHVEKVECGWRVRARAMVDGRWWMGCGTRRSQEGFRRLSRLLEHIEESLMQAVGNTTGRAIPGGPSKILLMDESSAGTSDSIGAAAGAACLFERNFVLGTASSGGDTIILQRPPFNEWRCYEFCSLKECLEIFTLFFRETVTSTAYRVMCQAPSRTTVVPVAQTS